MNLALHCLDPTPLPCLFRTLCQLTSDSRTANLSLGTDIYPLRLSRPSSLELGLELLQEEVETVEFCNCLLEMTAALADSLGPDKLRHFDELTVFLGETLFV